ncbi:MFS transporter [Streptomyces drozdowiczii]
MRLDVFRRVLRIPGLPSVLILGFLVKVPMVAIPMVLTLHVTMGQHHGFGQAGLVTAMWTAGVALGAPIQGRHLDRNGLRPLFVVGTVGQALFWGLAAQMSYPVLVSSALLSGLLIVPGATISRLAIAGLVSDELRHTAYAVDSMLTNVSYMTGPALGVVLATQATTNVAVYGIGAMLVVSGVVVCIRNPPFKPRGEEQSSAASPPPFSQWFSRGLATALACAFAAGTFSSGAEIGVVAALQHNNQMGWIGPLMLMFGIFSIVGGLAYGGLSRGPSAVVVVSALGVVTILLGIAGNTFWLTLSLLPAALIYAPAFAATAAAVSAFAVSGARASAMSLYSVATTVGTSLGSPVAGVAIDRGGPRLGFAAVGGMILLISLSAGALARHSRQPAIPMADAPSGNIDKEIVMSDMKRVVIVDAYAPSMQLAAQFREAGVALVRVQSTKEVPRFYQASFDLEGFLDNIVHEGNLDETISRVAVHEPIAVVAGGEKGVELADALSAALGLPSNGVELSEARRDKYIMVETVKRAGVPAARQIMVTDEQQLDMWHRSIEGRVVVKPLRSAAGDGVYFCDTPQEAIAAYRKINGATNIYSEKNSGVVAQEYLCGTEYVVNTVSRDGRHRVCEIWRTSRIGANGLSDLADAGYLISRRGEAQDQLARYSMQVLDSLGIQHGPAHLEIKLTNDGPRLVEVGARTAGGNIPSYAQLSIGESQLDWTVRAYLDPEAFHRDADKDYQRVRYVANVALVSPVEGVLRSYRDLNSIRQLESFHQMQVYVEPGERISRTVDDVTYPAAMLLLHDTEEVVMRDANTVRFLDGHGFYEIEPEVSGA